MSYTTAPVVDELTPVGSLLSLIQNPFVHEIKLYMSEMDMVICDMTMINGDIHSVSSFIDDYSESEFYHALLHVFAQGDEK